MSRLMPLSLSNIKMSIGITAIKPLLQLLIDFFNVFTVTLTIYDDLLQVAAGRRP